MDNFSPLKGVSGFDQATSILSVGFGNYPYLDKNKKSCTENRHCIFEYRKESRINFEQLETRVVQNRNFFGPTLKVVGDMVFGS